MANLPKINNPRLSAAVKTTVKNLSVLFWLGFVIILALDILTVKKAVEPVLQSQKSAPLPTQSRGVRINFSDYNKDVSRIENAAKFVPSAEAGADPFTGKRTAVPTTPAAATTTPD